MTLRMPLAAMLTGLLALFILGGFAARPVSALSVPGAETAIEAPAVEPAQINSPTESDAGDGWIWLGVAAFLVFTVIGAVFAIFGYMEATRRE